MICVYIFYFSFILVLYLHFVRNKRNKKNNNNKTVKHKSVHDLRPSLWVLPRVGGRCGRGSGGINTRKIWRLYIRYHAFS